MESKYCSVKQMINKKFDHVNYILVTLSKTPSIIAISQTRLNETDSQLNISIPGYTKARIPKQMQVEWDFIFMNI